MTEAEAFKLLFPTTPEGKLSFDDYRLTGVDICYTNEELTYTTLRFSNDYCLQVIMPHTEYYTRKYPSDPESALACVRVFSPANPALTGAPMVYSLQPPESVLDLIKQTGELPCQP